MIDDLGSLQAPDAVVTGVLALGHETVCFVSLELCALVLPLSLFFVKNLLSSWWTGEDVALTLILARQLLRGCCPPVPRSLPPVLCSGKAGPGLNRACSPGHITAYNLETGPWALIPHSCSYHPPPSHALSQLGVRVCLYILKCCLYYFLEILGCISSESPVPFSVTFDSFSSSAPSIFIPGLIWKRGWECWSVSSSTSLRGSLSLTALRLATLGHHPS